MMREWVEQMIRPLGDIRGNCQHLAMSITRPTEGRQA